MNLADILKTGKIPDELTSNLGQSLPETPVKQVQNPSGVKKFVSVMAMGILKALEIMLPLLGVESEEGKRIKRAITNISPLAKGASVEDLLAFLKMLENILPKGLGAMGGLGGGIGGGLGVGMEGAGGFNPLMAGEMTTNRPEGLMLAEHLGEAIPSKGALTTRERAEIEETIYPRPAR
ncbi:MAG: hypothetical protein ACK4GE_05100 [Caldimicrobium sp.]